MPYGVNLDIVIARTASPFPNILGNLMVNDYLRGLQIEKRIAPEDFLVLFENTDSDMIKAARADHRLIIQRQADNTSYRNNPKGAALAYSSWCNRWYLGNGRLKALVDALFKHADLAKSLISEKKQTGISFKDWNQELDEAIIRSLLHAMQQDDRADEAIRFYTNARGSDIQRALLNTWRQHISSRWETEMIVGEDLYRYETVGRTVYPAVVADEFWNNQAKQLIAFFGDVGSGTDGEMWKVCPGALFQRAFLQSVGELQELAQVAGDHGFDFRETYDDSVPEFYSFIVCCTPLIKLSAIKGGRLDDSLIGLEGISLLCPTKPITEIKGVLDALGAEYEREHGRQIPNIGGVWTKGCEEVLFPLRIDLYRCLLFSGLAQLNFAVDYRTIEDGDRVMLMRPIQKCLNHNEKAPFWPVGTTQKVPTACLKTIQEINDSAVSWKRSLMHHGPGLPRPALDGLNSNLPPADTGRAVGSEQVGIIVHPNAEPTVQLTGARSEMNLNQDVHSQSAVSRISGAGGGGHWRGNGDRL